MIQKLSKQNLRYMYNEVHVHITSTCNMCSKVEVLIVGLKLKCIQNVENEEAGLLWVYHNAIICLLGLKGRVLLSFSYLASK